VPLHWAQKSLYSWFDQVQMVSIWTGIYGQTVLSGFEEPRGRVSYTGGKVLRRSGGHLKIFNFEALLDIFELGIQQATPHAKFC